MNNRSTYTRILTAILALLLALSLTACTSDSTQNYVTTDITAETTTIADTTDAVQPESMPPTRDVIHSAWSNLDSNSSFDVEWRTDFTLALLYGDGSALAELLGVPTEVYACYDGIVITDWGVKLLPIEYYGSTLDMTVLDITVAESRVPALPAGEHSLVLEEGMSRTFTPIESLVTEPPEYSSAESFVRSVIIRTDDFGCDFIVSRLNSIADNQEPRTAEEIIEYARVCLGVELTEATIRANLEKVDGGYMRYGRGVNVALSTFAGEEVRGDTTVVTVRFWADYSQTVEARTVEYHLVPTDIDWKLVDTVTVCDSNFRLAGYAV